MAQTRGLGRGLGSLIPQKQQSAPSQFKTEKTQTEPARESTSIAAGIPLFVQIDQVVPNPHQPREDFSHAELEELINSIKIHGILQPLIVTDKKDGTYELIAGERRLRASRMAGLAAVPVIIRDAIDSEKLELALIENIQRQDLNALEEARAYKRLMEDHGLTQEQVASRVGKSRSQVANTLRLLDLPQEIQEAVRGGTVSASAARTLLSLGSKDEQIGWWQRMMSEKMSVHDVEEAVRRAQKPYAVHIPDVNLEADEAALRTSLGTKVSIKRRGDAGIIALSFFSPEEYRELVNRLSKNS